MALVAATLGHAALMVFVGRGPARGPSVTTAPTAPAAPTAIEIDLTPLDEPTNPAPQTAAIASPLVPTPGERPAPLRAPAGARAAPQTALAHENAAPQAAESVPGALSWSFDPTSFDPSQRVGSRGAASLVERSRSALQGPAPAESLADAAGRASRELERSIRDEIAQRDVARGLGRAGILVSAAHEAARTVDAPMTGEAVFEIECDATGLVTSVRASSSSWNAVGRAILRAMVGKRVRVAPGSRGLRASLHVAARLSLPAGDHGTTAAGAVPDDIPGGARACEGEGMNRRCVAGSPVGFTSAAGDLSNVGAHPSRVVHVRLLSEVEI